MNDIKRVICVRPRLTWLAPALALAGLFLSPLHADWPSWRGPHDSGSIAQNGFPTRLSADNPLWKTPLPGKGCSTPVVWQDRIFLTAPTNGLDAVMAFNLSGQPVWITSFGPKDPARHRNGSGSNASPVTDGSVVAVYFKSGTLAALELDGRVRWQTDIVKRFGPDNLFWDQGTSPVLTPNAIVMTRMHGGDSWVAAFDKRTGDIQWKVDRNYKTPVEGDNAYTTPLHIRHGDRDALLIWGAEHLTAHAIDTGELLWSCGGFNPRQSGYWPSVANAVVVGDIAIVPTGRNDRNQPWLHGIRLGGSGDVTATHRLWATDDSGSFVPTPAAWQGRAYLLRDRGQIDCIDPASGKVLWRGELPRHRSNYYSSPLIAGGILYAAREDGAVFVARIDNGFELIADTDLGEQVIASPVPLAGGRLLFRGEHHLFCFGSTGVSP